MGGSCQRTAGKPYKIGFGVGKMEIAEPIQECT
jgi:hypothetical protein